MDDNLFAAYAGYVRTHFGIQLPPAKKALLESRLYKLFVSQKHDEFHDAESFMRYLRQDQSGKAQAIMANTITTNHTYFMREKDHFRFYADHVLPYWEHRIKNGDVRTWCAACSSGEEAYTLAMILEDYFSLKGDWDTTLLATDVSREILHKARQGIFKREAVQTLPPGWQATYFYASSPGFLQVSDRIKKKILFRYFNLMSPTFPFRGRFQTIFCRNVMIYFDAPTRAALVRKFYDFLEPGGFLFVGHAEVVDMHIAPFSYVMPSVYQRR